MLERGRSQARRLTALGAATLVGLVLLAPAHAGTKLNGPFPPSDFARVLDFRISPDGARVVYRVGFFVDFAGPEAIELYSVPLHGGGPAVRLSAAMAPDQEVYGDFRISPDSSRVVYAADQDTPGITELYSVPIAGPASAGHKVNHPLGGGSVFAGFNPYIEDFAIDAASANIAFMAAEAPAFQRELYSAPLGGGPVVQLSELGSEVGAMELTPGSTVIYFGGAAVHAVPITGPASASQVLTLAGTGPLGLPDYAVSPDGSQIAYAIQVDASPERFQLFANGTGDMPVDSIALTSPLPSPMGSPRFSPDSARVTFTMLQRLHSVPADASASAVQLSPDGESVSDWDISPDSSRVVFVSSLLGDGTLYSVPAGGPHTGAIALAAPFSGGGELPPDTRPSNRAYTMTPDSQSVVYRNADADSTDLFRAPIDGPGPGVNLTNLTNFDTVIGGSLPSGFIVDPAGTRVVYRAAVGGGPVQLFSVALDGSEAPRTLNGPLNPAGVVAPGLATEVFDLTPDGADVVYLAAEQSQAIELYKAGAADSHPVVADPIVVVEVDEDAPDVVIDLNTVFDDADGDTLAFTVTSNSNPALVDTTIGSPLRLDFQPDRNGRADLRVTASDGTNEVSDEFIVLVNPVNDAPVARDDGPIEVGRGRAVIGVDVVGNDFDADDDFLSAEIVSPPAHGVASTDGGTVSYGHDGTAATADSFTYRAFDGDLFSAPATVTISVVPSAPTVGLVDPRQGLWVLMNSRGFGTPFFFGNPGDTPVMGDWDCDGIDTPGLFRTSDAFAYLSNANRSQIADIRFFFGDPSDLPLAGDWDGDGCDTLSIYRPSEQRFYIVNELGENEGGLGPADFSFGFGDPGDKPVVGDWDGDGIDEVGLHRESTGFFYWRNTLTTGVASGAIFFGDPGDRFVAGDWGTVDLADAPAVYRPTDATFYFRHTLTQGNADSTFRFPGVDDAWLPVAGNYGIG